MITTAFIKIWDETVGAVAWNVETRMARFEYDSKFITKKATNLRVKVLLKKLHSTQRQSETSRSSLYSH